MSDEFMKVVLLVFALLSRTQATRHRIPINQAPEKTTTSNSWSNRNSGGYQSNWSPHPPTVTLAHAPKPLSAPPSELFFDQVPFSVWAQLNNTCFEKSAGEYGYIVCPFRNVTQTKTWDSNFLVLLGVWGEWESTLEDGESGLAMRFSDGSNCMGTGRTIQILLECSNEAQLQEVLEPRMCQYVAVLAHPLACGLPLLQPEPPQGEVKMQMMHSCIGALWHRLGDDPLQASPWGVPPPCQHFVSANTLVPSMHPTNHSAQVIDAAL